MSHTYNSRNGLPPRSSRDFCWRPCSRFSCRSTRSRRLHRTTSPSSPSRARSASLRVAGLRTRRRDRSSSCLRALRTGKDGSADLRQGETTIAVGPETQLDFPAAAVSGGPIDRVSQPIGNAYYKVGPQGGDRLRVETPYLVAVIKGTQFNVAVTADSSTISLHEGRLEILATEENIAAIELNAGEDRRPQERRKDDSRAARSTAAELRRMPARDRRSGRRR